MTTELTLREKAIDAAWRDVKRELAKMMNAKPMPGVPADDWSAPAVGVIDLELLCGAAFDSLAETLDATGAPAYCRVADDLRGVVWEEGE